MNKSTMAKTATLTGIIITFACFWLYRDYQDSYPQPHQAIQEEESDLQLITAYKTNGKSLHLFIKNHDHLGAAYAHEGIFGWKSDMLTWGPMDQSIDRHKLSGMKSHGDSILYGLIRDGGDHAVKIDHQSAVVINLSLLHPKVVEEYDLEGLYLWYFEKDPDVTYEIIQLERKDTDEIVDEVNI
ncbi:hypothetical protein [Bacillus sp. KH172YL63]|uniref:hypothetical protein n=1 Tax=Bacillus sp. KH172YL63 TaxID=2709784 RepID=UPI0013E4E239|nr:hypothetical protein [Bacillus sp. KH172YL63]BCB03951.1 hypothetical protein KH172YL63_20840 [Bacillus sp. KH172YL63]